MDANKYTGNFDFEDRMGWRQLKSVEEEGVEWRVHYYLIGGKARIRVTANGLVKHKANYKQLAWVDGALSGEEESILRVHRPTLYTKVLESLALIQCKTKKPRGKGVRTFEASLNSSFHVTHNLGELDGVSWLLARKEGPPNGGWQAFKLIANGRVANKASYCFQWNGGRLSRNRDVGLLSEHRPELYERVIAALKGPTASDWEDLL